MPLLNHPHSFVLVIHIFAEVSPYHSFAAINYCVDSFESLGAVVQLLFHNPHIVNNVQLLVDIHIHELMDHFLFVQM